MSHHTTELLERAPYVRPVAFYGLSLDHARAHYKDVLGLAFPLDAAYLEPVGGQILTGRPTYFPFHGHLDMYNYSFEPAFIRKRNERERQRVRCVNEGYARLREHLPQEFEDKRLSKVETLRAAIAYIKRLQSLLDFTMSSGGGKVDIALGHERNPSLEAQRAE